MAAYRVLEKKAYFKLLIKDSHSVDASRTAAAFVMFS